MYELIHRPCKHCGKMLSTTGRREVVHPECRKDYYAKYRRNPAGLKKMTMNRNRGRWFVNTDQCAVCGYTLLTKKKKVCNPETKEYEFFTLCARCSAEFRCGFLDVITKKRFDASGAEIFS